MSLEFNFCFKILWIYLKNSSWSKSFSSESNWFAEEINWNSVENNLYSVENNLFSVETISTSGNVIYVVVLLS